MAQSGAQPAALEGCHPLDRVVWRALTGRQRHFAQGDDLARRYPAELAPFGAILDERPESYRSLFRLVPPGDRLALVTPNEVDPPREFVVAKRDLVDQMILEGEPTDKSRRALSRLTSADIPEMRALVELTKPGPFGPRTIELGRYLGVRVDEALIAMVGERMKIEDYTEISAVCVHPDSRGQGLAADLVTSLAHILMRDREIPFLHVFASNEPAIDLYRKLGFAVRRRMHLAVLQMAETR
jgi:ribosomal protein S18 acetylase RimI-like enzyme